MKSFLGMCFNPKVLAGIAALGVAVWLVAPQYVAAVLPLLVFALCPLSMAVMAWTMRGQHSPATSAAQDPAARLVALEREQARVADQIAQARGELARPAGTAERSENVAR